MRRHDLPLLLAAVLLATSPLHAADATPITQLGGSYEVEIVKGVAYCDGPDADKEKHKLDLFVPKGKKDFPVLFFVHGGAWRMGDRWMYGKLGETFAKNGVGTVIPSYRLSPAVQHPAHVQDVAKAFAWTVRNIEKHGGKKDQIFVSGHSAGGHLVALLATDESYLKAEKLSLGDIKGVLGLSGVYLVVTGRTFESVFGKDPEVVRNAAPIRHVDGRQPPFILIYADKDYATLDRMAEEMCKTLKEKKCDAASLKIADRDHITIIVRAANSIDDPTSQAMIEFIARHCGLKLMPSEK